MEINRGKYRIIIVLILIIIGLLVLWLYKYQKRDIIKISERTTITFWKDYIIFDEYKSIMPPKKGFIQTDPCVADFGELYIQIRENAEIVIGTDKEIVRNGLRDKFNSIHIYNTQQISQRFHDNYPLNDSLISTYLYIEVFRSHFLPRHILEFEGDSCVVTNFDHNTDIFCKSVIGKRTVQRLSKKQAIEDYHRSSGFVIPKP